MPETSLKTQVKKLMLANRRIAKGHKYTVPSPSNYPYQWFWDSCFHAIILSHFDLAMAKHELRALAAWQFKNGMIPHMIYWSRAPETTFPKIRWGKRYTSSLIQPPMLAYAVWAIYQKDHDKSFLKEMLPVINKLHDFLLRQRDPRKHSLIGLVHPDESGEDNSPRFDFALHLGPRQVYSRDQDINSQRRMKLIDKFRRQNFVIEDHMEKFHWVRDVPINAIFMNALNHEAKIAKELGDMAASQQAIKRAENVMSAMRAYMLDGPVMWSTASLSYKPIKVKTWAMFAPLFGEILTQKEAEELIGRFLNNPDEFKTPYSVPTVSISEPSFEADGFWRGPVWISTNWFMFKGLKKYGFEKEAARILDDSLKLITKSGFREYYSPASGEGFGAREFTWGGLVLDMMQ